MMGSSDDAEMMSYYRGREMAFADVDEREVRMYRYQPGGQGPSQELLVSLKRN